MCNLAKKERYIICGIFGYVKSKPEPFDFMEFCTLGVHNDTRGKDSVGIYIDGESEYYCKGANNSLFSDFISESRLLQSVETAQIAYGHDRAASIGDVSIKTAQPVILKNDEGKIEYVLMHNGTIYNYKDLAKKYIPDIDITGMTDSQVMARIFFHSGYDALGEYNGGAVFAIIDYREEKPRFFFWQGCSKQNQYSTSSSAQEERPLYFLKSDGELMFSSLNTYLNAFRRKAESLVPTHNVLISYDPDTQEFMSIEEYDRSKCFQSRGYNNISSNVVTTYSGTSYHTSNGYAGNYVYANTSDGLCYVNGKIMHGKYDVSDFGYVNPMDSMSHNEMWFWNGVLLKNERAYMYLEKFCQEIGVAKEEISKWYEELVRYLSPYPYISIIKNGITVMYKVDDPAGSEEYTGDVCYPFVSYMKTYLNGVYQSTKTSTISYSLELWRQHKNDQIDIDTLIRF